VEVPEPLEEHAVAAYLAGKYSESSELWRPPALSAVAHGS
jgi:hypothetical protein